MKEFDIGESVVVQYPFDRQWFNCEGYVFDKDNEELLIVAATSDEKILIDKQYVYKNEKEYEQLIVTSNDYHNAVYDYVEAKGVDEKLILQIKSKFVWLKHFAEKHDIQLEEDK